MVPFIAICEILNVYPVFIPYMMHLKTLIIRLKFHKYNYKIKIKNIPYVKNKNNCTIFIQ